METPPTKQYSVDDKVLVYHNDQLYDSKILKLRQTEEGSIEYFIHFMRWKKSHDSWVTVDRIFEINEENMAKKRELATAAGKKPSGGSHRSGTPRSEHAKDHYDSNESGNGTQFDQSPASSIRTELKKPAVDEDSQFAILQRVVADGGIPMLQMNWYLRGQGAGQGPTVPVMGNTLQLALKIGYGEEYAGTVPMVIGMTMLQSGFNDTLIPIFYRMVLTVGGQKIYDRYGYQAMRSDDTINVEASLMIGDLEKKSLFQCWVYFPSLVSPVVDARVDRKYRLQFNTKEYDADDENDYSDVQLIVIDKDRQPLRQFGCHRHILAVASSVFKTMLAKRSWLQMEMGEGGRRKIEISGIDGATVEKVLAFIYSGELPTYFGHVNLDSLIDLASAAQKFNLNELKEACENIFIWQLKERDPIDLLVIAKTCDLPRLKDICINLCTNVVDIYKKTMEGTISSDIGLEILAKMNENSMWMMKVVEFGRE